MTKRKGIRKRVTLIVTLLVITSLTVLGLALSWLIFLSQKNEHLALQEEVVKGAVNEINWDIHEIETLLNITVTSNDLLHLDGRKQFDSLSQILTHEDIKHHNVLDELILLDGAGRELTRVSRTIVYSASELGDRSMYDEFKIPVSSGKSHYGPIMYDKVTNEPHIMFSMPLLNIRKGTVDGVLLGRIRLNKIWENVADISFGESGIVFITDSKGKVVAHPDPSVIYRNTFYMAETPAGIQRGLNGKRAMIVSDRIKLGDRAFIVYTMVPFSEVLDLSLDTLSTTAMFLVVFILLSVAVSYVVIQRIVRPIELLADSARGISAGKLGPAVQIGNADEIGDLSTAFNVMTSKLLDTITSLKTEIAERKQAEEKIIKQNELLNNILNSLSHPFYVIDANDYTVKLANPAARFGEYTEKATCFALTHKRNKPCEERDHPCVINKIKESGKPVSVEHVHYDGNGKYSVYEIHGYPIFDAEGNIAQVIEYNLDITDRKRAEDALQISEEKNRTITTTAKDAIIMIDEKGRTSFWNPAAEKIFGYTQEEVLNKELHPVIAIDQYLGDYKTGFEKFAATGKGSTIGKTLELTARKKDGTEFPVELSLSAIQMQEKWHAIGIVRDITKRKQSENQIMASLKEKEVLLREIHHRTKNNMQIISSLLRLQSVQMINKKDIAMMNESQNRIKSMSLIHEKLYKSKDMANIDFSEYIEDLTNDLFTFYEPDIRRVELKLDTANIWLGIDTAIPCGLVINELVTNSLKHAFPEGRKGEVRISLRKIEGDELLLIVSDNGIGIPEKLDFRNTKTLGLLLVVTLSEEQLQGKVELNRDRGTEFRIRFRELKYEKRI